jgi:hypothetical protein
MNTATSNAQPAAQQPALRAFQVTIKRGAQVRCSFPVMGVDSMTVAEQHEDMCERGEYVSVKPVETRS